MDFEAWEKWLLRYRMNDLSGSLDHCLMKSSESEQVMQSTRTGKAFTGPFLYKPLAGIPGF